MPGIAPRGGRGPGGEARSTPRMIAQFRRCASGGIVRFGGRSQVVAQQEIQRAAPLAHRHALTARVVVLDHRARAGATGPLEVVADVAGGHAVQHGFDAVGVAVT